MTFTTQVRTPVVVGDNLDCRLGFPLIPQCPTGRPSASVTTLTWLAEKLAGIDKAP